MEKQDVPPRPIVFFEITIEEKKIGRIIFELFNDIVPLTSENFRVLCTGEKVNENPDLHYKNSYFHRIVPDFVAHGGDVTRGDGRGGLSIYGPTYNDENFKCKHSIEGLLSMANKGPNTNNSQFMITLYPCPWLDGKHVVFGRVIQGYSVVRKMEEVGSELGEPSKKVKITDCGEIDNYY